MGQLPKEFGVLKCHLDMQPSVGLPTHPEDLCHMLTFQAQTKMIQDRVRWQRGLSPRASPSSQNCTGQKHLFPLLFIHHKSVLPHTWRMYGETGNVDSPRAHTIRRLLLHMS